MNRITLRIWALISLAGLVCALPTFASTEQEIVVGMSAPFTGSSKQLGIELYRGSMAYFAKVNSEGGIHGRKIKIKAYDDKYDPATAINNTIQLMCEDNVLLLLNYVGTPATTRVLPLLKRHRDEAVFLFFPFSGAQLQRQQPYGDFVFNLRASYFQETAGLVDNFIAVGRKRISIFYQSDSYGRNGWEGVRDALARHRLKMAGEATYRRATKFQDSLREQVDILRKADSDAVISIGSYEACAAFIRDARDLGWNVPIANVSFVGSETLLELLRVIANATGKDYTSHLINSEVLPSYEDEKLPAAKEFRKLMAQHQPLPPQELLDEKYTPAPCSFVSFEGFLNAKLLVGILQKMDAPFERTKLKQIAESIQSFDIGIDVPISLGAGRHQASDRVYFMEVKEGRFRPLDDWNRWRR